MNRLAASIADVPSCRWSAAVAELAARPESVLLGIAASLLAGCVAPPPASSSVARGPVGDTALAADLADSSDGPGIDWDADGSPDWAERATDAAGEQAAHDQTAQAPVDASVDAVGGGPIADIGLAEPDGAEVPVGAPADSVEADAADSSSLDMEVGPSTDAPADAGDAVPKTDLLTSADAGSDGCAPCPSYPALAWTPSVPQAGQAATFDAYDTVGWTYVAVDCTSSCAKVAGNYAGVVKLADGAFHWTWTLTFASGGDWACAFTAESGAKTLASAKVSVAGPPCSLLCPAVGVACQDTYPETKTCAASGTATTVTCNKIGTCTGVGDGTQCSWGPGSACSDPCSPAEVVATAGKQFVLAGKPFKFIGMNVRGLVHYGGNDVLPYSQHADIGLTLDVAKAMGVKVVRVFAANQQVPVAVSAQRLLAALDQAQARGIRLIIALTDEYASGFSPPGDQVWYAKDDNGYLTLKPEFFANGWQQGYLSSLKALVGAAKSHPAVFAWEIGNELKNPKNPADFVSFALNAAQQIKAIDGQHLIAVGLISLQNAALSPAQSQQLFGNPLIGFLTVHAYNGSEAEDDSAAAAGLGKPFLVEEAGFSGANRGPKVDADVAKWIGKGASGYLQWGLMATAGDNGDGDADVGMDQILATHPGDWAALVAVYGAWATKLGSP